MSVKSSTELMLYVVLTMPTLNKAYLFIYLFIVKKDVNFGNDGKGISSCIVKSRVGYFAYSLDDAVASTGPVTVKQ